MTSRDDMIDIHNHGFTQSNSELHHHYLAYYNHSYISTTPCAMPSFLFHTTTACNSSKGRLALIEVIVFLRLLFKNDSFFIFVLRRTLHMRRKTD